MRNGGIKENKNRYNNNNSDRRRKKKERAELMFFVLTCDAACCCEVGFDVRTSRIKPVKRGDDELVMMLGVSSCSFFFLFLSELNESICVLSDPLSIASVLSFGV